jgi:inner membrane protein
MDSLTHIVLGAAIGEAYAGKKIGKRAMIYGALSQSLPDIDFIASFWLTPADNLLAHRGITHSILFAVAAAIVLGLIANRWHRNSQLSLTSWIAFFVLEIFTHLILDAFNTYGVGWFEPFNHYRISFNTLFVADPFFSIGLIAAFIALLLLKETNKRNRWTKISLSVSGLYLMYALVNKAMINHSVKENLAQQHISYKQFFTTPTALNTWLWYIVVEDNYGYHIGYQSVFDNNKNIDFHYFYRQDSLLGSLRTEHHIQQLMLFSRGFYTVENYKGTLIFNDLKFGQIMGWENPDAQFVFHYFIKDQQQNLLVIQRGRFTGWNTKSIKGLIKRIEGNYIQTPN